MRAAKVLICEETEMEVDEDEQKEPVSLRKQNAEWEAAARSLAEQEQQLEASGTPVKVNEITYTLTEYTRRELNEDDAALHADNEDYDGKDDEEEEEEDLRDTIRHEEEDREKEEGDVNLEPLQIPIVDYHGNQWKIVGKGRGAVEQGDVAEHDEEAQHEEEDAFEEEEAVEDEDVDLAQQGGVQESVGQNKDVDQAPNEGVDIDLSDDPPDEGTWIKFRDKQGRADRFGDEWRYGQVIVLHRPAVGELSTMDLKLLESYDGVVRLIVGF